MKKGVFLIILMLFTGLFSGDILAQDHHDETHEKSNSELYNESVLNHIADANEFHLWGDLAVPLPVILYDLERKKLIAKMSSVFEHGHKAVDGFVMNHGNVMKIVGDFPEGEHDIHETHHKEVGDNTEYYIEHEGKEYQLEDAASLLEWTGFIDFSISKVVFTMLFAGLLLILVFRAVVKGFRRNEGAAPSGVQSFMEPIIIFVRDEIAKPALGPKWEKYFPFVATLFFFIAFNNLIGLIPIFPGSGNTMGNLGVTMALALLTFIITTVSGNKHYWQHILWMPGVPVAVKPILSVIEILGMFTKPFTLMIRLFANITAGHVIILSLVGIIFLLGNNGASIGGGIGGTAMAVPFLIAMNLLEIFVALLQAFIFALLSALYIGEAIAEH